MLKGIFAAALALVIFSSFASAQELSQLKIDLQISPEGTASGIISGSSDLPELKLDLPFEPKNLKSADQISVNKNSLTIKNPSSFSASFDTEKLTSTVGSEAKLLSLVFSPGVVENFNLKISLPESAAIVDRNGLLLITRPISPISTDGQNIFLDWKRNNFSEETFFVQYKAKGGEFEFGLVHIVLIIIIVLAGGIFAGWKFKKFRKEKFIKEKEKIIKEKEKSLIREKEKFIEENLGPEEKKVVAEIKKAGGEILQESLRAKHGWSKTKSSKLVARLESKGVVEKKVYGKTNRLRLK